MLAKIVSDFAQSVSKEGLLMTRIINYIRRPMGQAVHALCLISFSFIIAFSGCDRTYVADSKSSKDVQEMTGDEDDSSTETASVSPDLANRKSPADVSEESLDATPQDVCQNFMNYLRDGKRIDAENLLTRTALTVTTKAGLQLEPMGGPTANYNVNDVRFATTKAKLAQVECSIVETIDGETYEMEVTWLARKQSNGWRISGVMLELQEGSVKDLLSFENMQDVTKIKNIAGSDVLEEDPTRQAKSTDPIIK